MNNDNNNDNDDESDSDKDVIWYMALPNETILRERTIISTKHRPNKKLG